MIYWIWLTQINGIGSVSQRILLDNFKSPEKVYNASYEQLIKCKGIGKDKATRILKARSLDDPKRIFKRTEELGIKLLNLHDSLYPDGAKGILEMPILLYYKGHLIEDSMGVSIVGARRCSEYGKNLALDLGLSLAKSKIPVISGMAKGIDSYAHTACIKGDGYPLAFLGNGIDICYPPEHKGLMDEIIKRGAVISEYPPGTRPNPLYFPRRNLLICGWSKKILIVEAGLKSGSLITGDFGLKYGREVFAVPHNLDYVGGVGTNFLILKGASIFLKKDQLGIKKLNKSPLASGEDLVLSDDEKNILGFLDPRNSITIENLASISGYNKTKVLEVISLLDLNGLVEVKGNIIKQV